MEQVYKTFTFSEEDGEDTDDYATVITKLDNYCVPKVNTIHKRACFCQYFQKPGETSEESCKRFGISKDIQEIINTVKSPGLHKKREPLITTQLPSRPWERVAADICKLN